MTTITPSTGATYAGILGIGSYRPRYGVHLRRRGRRRDRWTDRRTGHRPGGVGLGRHAAPGDQPDRVVAGGGRPVQLAAPGDGRQPGVPVGVVRDGEGRPAGAGRG